MTQELQLALKAFLHFNYKDIGLQICTTYLNIGNITLNSSKWWTILC